MRSMSAERTSLSMFFQGLWQSLTCLEAWLFTQLSVGALRNQDPPSQRSHKALKCHRASHASRDFEEHLCTASASHGFRTLREKQKHKSVWPTWFFQPLLPRGTGKGNTSMLRRYSTTLVGDFTIYERIREGISGLHRNHAKHANLTHHIDSFKQNEIICSLPLLNGGEKIKLSSTGFF